MLKKYDKFYEVAFDYIRCYEIVEKLPDGFLLSYEDWIDPARVSIKQIDNERFEIRFLSLPKECTPELRRDTVIVYNSWETSVKIAQKNKNTKQMMREMQRKLLIDCIEHKLKEKYKTNEEAIKYLKKQGEGNET